MVRCYGTLGPACAHEATLRAMMDEGMTGIRLNLSHSSLMQCESWIQALRRGADGRRCDLLIDLQGPEVRLGNKMPVTLDEGASVVLGKDIPVPEMVLQALVQGQQLLLDDGKLLLEVMTPPAVRVVRGGQLLPHKSLAIRGVSLPLPTLTPQDVENLKQAKRFGVTEVMLPFVRSAEDLHALRQTLWALDLKDIRILAKIENQQGVDQLEQLLPGCDEIVIARGDLGNAVPLWMLPGLQRRIGQTCRRAGKPYMVVTQMLDSMRQRAVPTRAEVSDVDRAVYEGASSVMLTAETAVGRYPVEAMRYLVQTARRAEQDRLIEENK